MPGNEMADRLAKLASILSIRLHYKKVPLGVFKKFYRMKSEEKWQNRYIRTPQGRITKLFFPDLKTRRQVDDYAITGDTVQVFTGHGIFKSYLYRFELERDPTCLCDKVSI